MRSAVQSSASRLLRPRARATRSTRPPLSRPRGRTTCRPGPVTTARLPLRPQRHSCPARDVGCPRSSAAISGVERGARRRRPASRARSSPPPDGNARARCPWTAAAGRRGWQERADKGAGPGSGIVPSVLPPARRPPRRWKRSARHTACPAGKGDPSGKMLKSRQIMGGAHQLPGPAARSGFRAAQWVGSTRRRAYQLNGSTAANSVAHMGSTQRGGIATVIPKVLRPGPRIAPG